jgi:cytochrome c553
MIARISILMIALTVQTAFAQTAPATSKPDLARAKQTAETLCAACHGPDGNGIAATFPKLAGQHEAYLLKQLHDFKATGNKPAARVNATMAPMAAPLSDEDMRGLAAYFSQLKQKPDIAKNRSTVELGQRIWRAGDKTKGLPACAGCHGPNGLGIPTTYPKLQGQYADYVEAQLKTFRTGERANDASSQMRVVAGRLSDAEIKAVADYAAGLR